jgi:hypothetical protein
MLRAHSSKISTKQRENCTCLLIPSPTTGKVQHDDECEFLFTHGHSFCTDATTKSKTKRDSSFSSPQQQHEQKRISEIELQRRQNLRKQFLLMKNRREQQQQQEIISFEENSSNNKSPSPNSANYNDPVLQPSRAYIRYAKQLHQEKNSQNVVDGKNNKAPSEKKKSRSPRPSTSPHQHNNKKLIYITEHSPQSQQEKVAAIFGSTKDRLSYFPNQGLVGTVRKISSRQERKAAGCEIFDVLGRGSNSMLSKSNAVFVDANKLLTSSRGRDLSTRRSSSSSSTSSTSSKVSAISSGMKSGSSSSPSPRNRAAKNAKKSPNRALSSSLPSKRSKNSQNANQKGNEKGPKNFVSTPYYHSFESSSSTLSPATKNLSQSQNNHYSARSMFSIPYSDESDVPLLTTFQTRPAYSSLSHHQQQILQQYQNSPYVSPASRRKLLKEMKKAEWISPNNNNAVKTLKSASSYRRSGNNNNVNQNDNNNNENVSVVLLNDGQENLLLMTSCHEEDNERLTPTSRSGGRISPSASNNYNGNFLSSPQQQIQNQNQNGATVRHWNSASDFGGGAFETTSSSAGTSPYHSNNHIQTQNANNNINQDPSIRRKSISSSAAGAAAVDEPYKNSLAARLSSQSGMNNHHRHSLATRSSTTSETTTTTTTKNNQNNNKNNKNNSSKNNKNNTNNAKNQNPVSTLISQSLAQRYLASFKSLLLTSGIGEERWFNGASLSVESRDSYMREWGCCALMRRLILENYDDMLEWATTTTTSSNSNQKNQQEEENEENEEKGGKSKSKSRRKKSEEKEDWDVL